MDKSEGMFPITAKERDFLHDLGWQSGYGWENEWDWWFLNADFDRRDSIAIQCQFIEAVATLRKTLEIAENNVLALGFDRGSARCRRDMFAAAALQGLLSSGQSIEDASNDCWVAADNVLGAS